MKRSAHCQSILVAKDEIAKTEINKPIPQGLSRSLANTRATAAGKYSLLP
jgi:hypothetical protein